MYKNKILKYFDRIKLNLDLDDLKLDYNLLKTLQFAHVTNIAYENLDIMQGIPLSVEPEKLFHK